MSSPELVSSAFDSELEDEANRIRCKEHVARDSKEIVYVLSIP